MNARLRPKVTAELLELLSGSSMLFRLGLVRSAAGEIGFSSLSDAVNGAKVAVGGAAGEATVGEAVGSRGGEFADLAAGTGGDGANGAVDVDVGSQVVGVITSSLADLPSEV